MEPGATQRPPAKRRKVDTSLLAPAQQPVDHKAHAFDMLGFSLPSPGDCSILQGFMDHLTSFQPCNDMAEDCKQAAVLQALAEGFEGVQSGALLQLLGRQLNAWARHTVAASAQLATQEDCREDLLQLVSCILGERLQPGPRIILLHAKG